MKLCNRSSLSGRCWSPKRGQYWHSGCSPHGCPLGPVQWGKRRLLGGVHWYRVSGRVYEAQWGK